MDTPSFTADHQSFSPERLTEALSNDDFMVRKKEERWYALIRKLPKGLQSALLAEINLGNYVTSLQYANWPQKGSILVSLGMPFKIDFSTNDFGVKKRVLNDPHYWSEDIYQAVNGIEHLIIC
jgi:hypothetical protein